MATEGPKAKEGETGEQLENADAVDKLKTIQPTKERSNKQSVEILKNTRYHKIQIGLIQPQSKD